MKQKKSKKSPPDVSLPQNGKSKLQQESAEARPSDKLRRDDEASSCASVTSDQVGSKSGNKGKVDKTAAKDTRRMEKSEARVEKTAEKLSTARDKFSMQKPQKPSGALRTLTQAAGYEVWAKAHGKIHEVERDNVGVEAAHHGEILAEKTGRVASRFIKHRNRTRPARRVHKWEHKNIKANADLRFRQMAQEHPELKDNVVKQHLKKRKLRKQYEKQAKETAKKAAKKTGDAAATAAEKVGYAVVTFVKRHPFVSLIALLCFVILLILQSCMAGSVSIGNGLVGAVGASTYPSGDADMIAAEAAYARMEAALQYELDNYASLHPGHDEYNFNLATIEHDPYVLISILCAWHEGVWTLAEAQGMLSQLFERQYILTQTVTVEVRYRTESSTYTDPETGETTTESTEVPYDYSICSVTLENFNLSHLPVYFMSEEQLSRYALYMVALGNRPDLFPNSLYPHATNIREYTHYGIPPAYLEDAVFAAIIKEAEKYLGFPYVWGGSSPSTSFDCSGFISWVLNHSGWNIGRLTAQGIYDICTPVSSANAHPGDLIFFVGTYSTSGVSHVGIYVGDGMMLHCGDPISYASVNTTYWQNHFYNYGRLP